MKKTLSLLESIAKQYPRESEEYKALELAAKALIFIHDSNRNNQFKEFLRKFGSGLSPEEMKRFKELGLDKLELEEDQ